MDNSYNLKDVLKYTDIVEEQSLVYRSIDDFILNGRTISFNQKEIVSFASCSYLGLELDPRLKTLAAEMALRYGTAFPTSRSYYKLQILEELELLLEQMFEKPCIHTTTTSLGHIAALPVLIGKNDAIIYDHQVHNSVRNAFMICKGAGTYTEALRHNRMDLLEEKVVRLQTKYDNVWFLGDGIYSMMGDAVGAEELYRLMNKYKKFRVYLDDAHGIGWCGKNGRGYVLDKIEMHPQMVMAASLGKGFGSFGGVLVCPDAETKRLFRKLGSTLIFSTPNMPAVLGASIASARIHLSDEITRLQAELRSKVDLFISEVSKYDLLKNLRIDKTDSPIFFFGVGKPETGIRSLGLIVEKGFYPSLAMHPAMPVNNTGIRVTITRTHTNEEIVQFAKAVNDSIILALAENGLSAESIVRHFDKLLGLKSTTDNVDETVPENIHQ
ncbi:MAG: aminotransferase class I/II-fold pyridoxal phosphate-dependent enzyme [Bacteroidales bacterium]